MKQIGPMRWADNLPTVTFGPLIFAASAPNFGTVYHPTPRLDTKGFYPYAEWAQLGSSEKQGINKTVFLSVHFLHSLHLQS